MQSLRSNFRVDGSVFLMIGLHVLTMATTVQLQYQEPIFTMLIATVYGPILATTILIHEFAQAATKKWCQQQPKDSPYITPVHEELYCTLAGPLSHIPQALVWLYLYTKITLHHDGNLLVTKLDLEIDMDNLKEGCAFVSTMAMQALIMNLVMFHLNILLPVHPFPGARILVALLVLCGFSLTTAGVLAAIVAMLTGIVAFWAALLLFLMNTNIVAWSMGALSCFTMFSGVRLLRMAAVTVNVQDHVLFQRDCYRDKHHHTSNCRQRRRRRKEGDSNDKRASISVIV